MPGRNLAYCAITALVVLQGVHGWSASLGASLLPHASGSMVQGKVFRCLPTVGRIRSLLGLRMQKQWKEDEPIKGEEQWNSFSVYNMGRWKGRALHLSPQDGQYIAPFSTDTLVDVMRMGDGVQVGVHSEIIFISRSHLSRTNPPPPISSLTRGKNRWFVVLMITLHECAHHARCWSLPRFVVDIDACLAVRISSLVMQPNRFLLCRAQGCAP